MTTQEELQLSRALGVAHELKGTGLSSEIVKRLAVCLTGEAHALSTSNGQWCFIFSLLLLARGVGHVIVALPEVPNAFRRKVRMVARRTHSLGRVSIVRASDMEWKTELVGVLNVGSRPQTDLKWTTINSEGWVARVSSDGTPLPDSYELPNPIAAMLAASLGAAEIFKRTYQIPADVVPPMTSSQFSLFDLNLDGDIGPPLPDRFVLPPTAIFGGGAIGNGIVLLLSQLNARGRVHIVDKQEFGDENLGTCVLLNTKAWVGKPKATQLARWLNKASSLQVSGAKELIASARSKAPISEMGVELILNGLDDIGARHDSQMLWPQLLIDGGINSVGAGVTVSRLDHPEAACLRCAYQLPNIDATGVQIRATGLSTQSLEDQDRLLTEADVMNAAEEKRDWLMERLRAKKTVCATVSEGVQEMLGMTLSFSPSAPFVATTSAALVITEMVKALFYPGTRYVQRFQFESVFLGLNTGSAVRSLASSACLCKMHRPIIQSLARERGRKIAQSTAE